MTSSNLKRSPSSPRSNENAQPPRSNPSAPPGSSITPSTVMNCDTTILPMVVPLGGGGLVRRPRRLLRPPRSGAAAPPAPPPPRTGRRRPARHARTRRERAMFELGDEDGPPKGDAERSAELAQERAIQAERLAALLIPLAPPTSRRRS